MQLKEEELEQIYNYDLELAEKVSLISKTIQDEILEPMSSGFVLKQVFDIEQILIKRTNLINQYK
jgi:nucleoside diphosphate kinase